MRPKCPLPPRPGGCLSCSGREIERSLYVLVGLLVGHRGSLLGIAGIIENGSFVCTPICMIYAYLTEKWSFRVIPGIPGFGPYLTIFWPYLSRYGYFRPILGLKPLYPLTVLNTWILGDFDRFRGAPKMTTFAHSWPKSDPFWVVPE